MNSPGLETPGEVRWRVGHISDPTGFAQAPKHAPWSHMGGTHRSHMGEIGLSQIGGTPHWV